MMSDRSNGPDTSLPYRPYYLCPARNGLIGDWEDPRGIGMYWRVKWTKGATSTSYPDWSDEPSIQRGPLTPAGGTVTNGTTMTLKYDITGRVVPHQWVYTIKKVSSSGSVTYTTGTVDVTGPGEYTITFTASSGASASAELDGSSTRNQFNLLDDT